MADIELNSLKVKSDALPDDWLMMLINPTSGQMAENMTVAKFTELLNPKLWENTILKWDNGWCKLPNGLIIQWGYWYDASAGGSRIFTISFPISFTKETYQIMAMPVTHIQDTQDNFLQRSATYKIGFNGVSTSKSSIRGYIVCDTGYGAGVRWIAIGF